ncbi:hypothetical protein DIPPA_05642 [Diplonema papillatum]|nr:hypothetical protein DIPPA_05642 [Diplonema papillatum]
MWAETTLQERRGLWRRLQAWTSERGLLIDANVACVFLAATGVRPQGLLTYAKSLSAVFGSMGLDNSPLRVLSSALRNTGAAVPLCQATPVKKQTLLSWAEGQPATIRLGVFLCWKAAARWGEVASLSSHQFLLVTAEEVIVDWMQTPKGRRRNPFRASRFTVVKGHLTAEIAALYQVCAPFRQLSAMTATTLDATWARTPTMNGFSAHSIKRGAMTHLFALMACGEPISPYLVDRLGKHEEKGGPGTLSDMTIRYGGGLVDMARALETGKSTIFL